MKKSALITVCIIASIVISTEKANAALIQGNDPGMGAGSDGFNLTIDTDTGLQWLDLSAAVGRSFNDVVSNFAVGGDFEGYRHATWSEIFEFWTNAGINYTLNFTNQPSNRDAILTLMGLMGLTSQSFFAGEQRDSALGWFDDTADNPTATSPSRVGLRQVVQVTPDASTGLCSIDECVGAFRWAETVFTFDTIQPGTGHMLVATSVVPLPATVWLFSSGLLGLIGILRRKKSA